jgi:uncharacterized protein YjbI with pentapeptide repeats
MSTKSLEERIQNIAQQVKKNRFPSEDTQNVNRDNWCEIEAEKIANNKLKAALHWLNTYLTIPAERWLEYRLAEMKRSALIEILELLGNFGIVIAVVLYYGTEEQRRDAEISNAWQTITSAHGQPGNGGRIRALQFLNVSEQAHWRHRSFPLSFMEWPKESLSGVDVSQAYLEGINLYKADLVDANLDNSNLIDAILINAKLSYASLEATNLTNAKLSGAILYQANLSNASLLNTSLVEAKMMEANLSGAILINARLNGADLSDANLTDANLFGADLDTANLSNAILLATDLRTNDLFSNNLTAEQLSGENQPYLCNVALSNTITGIETDRDCDILPQVLEERYENLSLEDAQKIVEDARQRDPRKSIPVELN